MRLTTVTVTFRQPVIGVTPGSLTINGRSARSVTGQGAGPYLFSGFAELEAGVATVSLSPTGLLDDAKRTVAGSAWAYHLLEPSADDDGDGLPNAMELEQLLTDPTTPDTDRDNLPDPYEVASRCLDPAIHEGISKVEGMAILPGDEDADDDGMTNVEEFLRGTDPCRSTAHTTRSR